MEKKKNILLKEKVEKSFFNNPIFVSIWMIVVFLSSLITIFNGYSLLKKTYLNTLGYKYEQYKKLSQLKTNVDIDTYMDLFGKPTRVVSDPDLKIKTYVFNKEYYYLDAVTNRDNAVMIFGVTSKEEDFQPSFMSPDKNLVITLNKTSFYDIYPYKIESKLENTIDSFGNYCMGFLGARRFGYFESHYLANPGNYQTIIVGINDAGFVKYPEEGKNQIWDFGVEINRDCSKIEETARKNGIINTYRVTKPLLNTPYYATKSADLFIGVDYDELRVTE